MRKSVLLILLLLFFRPAHATNAEEEFSLHYKKFRDTLFISPEDTATNITAYLESNEEKLSKENKGKLLFMLVRSYLMNDNVELATSSLEKYKVIVDHFNNPSKLYNYHNLSAVLFNALGLYKLSLENLEEAYKIALETQKEQFIVQIEYNIAFQYISLGFYNKARKYFSRYHAHSKKIADDRQTVSALTQLAIIEHKLGNYREALAFNEQSLELRVKNNFKFNEHLPYLYMGMNYLSLNELSLSKANVLKSKEILIKKANNKDLTEVNLELVKIMLLEGDKTSALSLINEVNVAANKFKQIDLHTKALKLKAEIEYKIGRYEDSYFTMLDHEKKISGRLQQQQELAISFLLSQRDGISKDLKLAQVNQEKALIATQSKSRKNQLLLILLFSSVIIFVVLIFIYKLGSKNRQLKSSIEELDETLQTLRDTQYRLLETEKMKAMTTLVSGLAHQMNTPLGVIITAVSTLKDKLEIEQENLANKKLTASSLSDFFIFAKQTIIIANESTNKTSSLIERFKMISAQLERTEILTFEFTSFAKETVATILQHNKLDVDFDIVGDPVQIKSFHSCWIKIISQLVENSLNHGFDNTDKPLVILEVSSTKDDLIVKYTDNGKGIEEDELSTVFNPFYTTSLNSSFLGLGLSVIYNAVVHMMGGKIECLDSTQGVCFKITTPKIIDD